jgi:hypothetical protein
MSQKDQKSRNGSILSFFKPVPKSQSASETPTSSAAQQSQSSLPPSSPLSIRSSPNKGTLSSKSHISKQEIGASDDDDGDDGSFSDDSLEDLSTLLGQGRPANVVPKAKPASNPYATPRSKRTAVEFHSSPLAVMPKHKFDLKALAKDALQDDATNASSLRVKSAKQKDDDERLKERGHTSPMGNTLVDIVNDQGGHNAQKVLRAVQRSEPGQAQLWYCFFDQDYKSPSSSPIPKKGQSWALAAHHPW